MRWGGSAGIAVSPREVKLLARLMLAATALTLISASTARGEPAPELVKDINTASSGADSSPGYLTSVGDRALFVADDGVHGRELWRSDGTEAGTELVADIKPGPSGSDPNPMVEGLPYVAPTRFAVIDDVIYFTADDGVHGYELWRSDGTAGGTALVADIAPGAADSVPFSMTSIGGVLYFAADDDVHGREPWTSDGTTAGTAMLADVRPGSAGSISGFLSDQGPEFVALGGSVYFAANDGVHGQEPWKVDGDTGAASILKDIRPGSTGSSGSSSFWGEALAPDRFHLTPVSGRLVFAADDGSAGEELWVSDGTAGGTQLLHSFVTGSGGGLASWWGSDVNPEFVEIDGTVFFTITFPGSQLWRTDGTAAGTSLLATGVSPGKELTDVDGTLYFGGGGWEPWVSDGTPAGTRRVLDINAGGSSSYSYPHSFHSAGGGMALFVAHTPATGRELWLTDGTAAGTRMLDELAPGPAHALGWGQAFAALGDRLLLPVDDAVDGDELWSIPLLPDPPPAGDPGDGDGEPESEPDSKSPPPGPADTGPAPTTGQTTAPAAGGRIAVAGHGTVRGRTLRLTVRCRGGGTCAGAKLIVRATRAGAARTRSVLLATRRIRIAAGRKATISLQITSEGRKLLAKRRRPIVRASGPGIAATTVRLEILRDRPR